MPEPPRQPAARYRRPAEWEPHEATWLAWPHNRTDWPGKMAAVAWDYGELIRRLAPGEDVRLLVTGPGLERRARRVLADLHVDEARVRFLRAATNRGWTRDMGPLFAHAAGAPGPPAVLRFAFNGWGRYRNWRLDARVPGRVARALDLPGEQPLRKGKPVVLEGGAIDVNGAGDLLTTEECLLDAGPQCRNPGMTRPDYERLFAEWLGARNTIWLASGTAGEDDTHGHVDDVCRFVNPSTVVLAVEEDPGDENHRRSRENRERLEGARLLGGARPEVVPLPFPRPLAYRGVRLPASYANFYIANAAVLVPVFNDPNDGAALGILSELFTDRPVVGVYAGNLIVGLGSIHCLTHEQPLPAARGARRGAARRARGPRLPGPGAAGGAMPPPGPAGCPSRGREGRAGRGGGAGRPGGSSGSPTVRTASAAPPPPTRRRPR